MATFAFRNSPAFSDQAARRSAAPATPSTTDLDELYGRPAATADEMDRMSYHDTIMKTLGAFAVLLVGAAVGWVFPLLAIVGGIAGFVLALVNTFKKKPSPALVLLYAFAEGLLVGGISSLFAGWYDGIVPMAIFGTLAVVAVTLALFASGRVRASARATKIFLVALVGYLAFSVVNLILMFTGVLDGFSATGGLRGIEIPIFGGIPLGIPLGILVVFMAAYSLVLDFDQIKRGVEAGAPRVYGWIGAFGIVVTVVWLYLEILRLLSYFLPRN